MSRWITHVKQYAKTNNISYRIYSIDYNNKLIFKFPDWRLLYINKKHWKQAALTALVGLRHRLPQRPQALAS
jgi:hypothetical protein